MFAKTDIQPLLNQGARKEDVAASIYQAVVNQTIAGLAQGRRIRGNVLFLGGPLYYCKGLRQRFCETLELDEQHACFPEYGRFAVALGAAMYAEKNGLETDCDALIARFDGCKNVGGRPGQPEAPVGYGIIMVKEIFCECVLLIFIGYVQFNLYLCW